MKIIFKIYKPDMKMQEYLIKERRQTRNELVFITDWHGGKVYEAVNEAIRKHKPSIASMILWQKGNNTYRLQGRRV